MTSVTSGADIDHKVGPNNPKPKLDHQTNIQSILLFLAILGARARLHRLQHLA